MKKKVSKKWLNHTSVRESYSLKGNYLVTSSMSNVKFMSECDLINNLSKKKSKKKDQNKFQVTLIKQAQHSRQYYFIQS